MLPDIDSYRDARNVNTWLETVFNVAATHPRMTGRLAHDSCRMVALQRSSLPLSLLIPMHICHFDVIYRCLWLSV